MEAVSYTNLRQNLKTHLDKVYQDKDPLIVTRKGDKNVVVLSLEEYNRLVKRETGNDAMGYPEGFFNLYGAARDATMTRLNEPVIFSV